jgi:hypothetical protein
MGIETSLKRQTKDLTEHGQQTKSLYVHVICADLRPSVSYPLPLVLRLNTTLKGHGQRRKCPFLGGSIVGDAVAMHFVSGSIGFQR